MCSKVTPTCETADTLSPAPFAKVNVRCGTFCETTRAQRDICFRVNPHIVPFCFDDVFFRCLAFTIREEC